MVGTADGAGKEGERNEAVPAPAAPQPGPPCLPSASPQPQRALLCPATSSPIPDQHGSCSDNPSQKAPKASGPSLEGDVVSAPCSRGDKGARDAQRWHRGDVSPPASLQTGPGKAAQTRAPSPLPLARSCPPHPTGETREIRSERGGWRLPAARWSRARAGGRRNGRAAGCLRGFGLVLSLPRPTGEKSHFLPPPFAAGATSLGWVWELQSSPQHLPSLPFPACTRSDLIPSRDARSSGEENSPRGLEAGAESRQHEALQLQRRH